MSEKGFYTIDDNQLIHAPESVGGKDWSIWVKRHKEYKYPVRGWYYFETREEAKKFFNYEDPPDESPDDPFQIPDSIQERERINQAIEEWVQTLEIKPKEEEITRLKEMATTPARKTDQESARTKN